MPESINDISNDMEQLRKSTEETAQQMAELQARIEGVIRSLAEARGKTVSPESVTRAAQRVTGEENVPGRVTVAPGQRIRTGAIGEELRTLQEEAKAIEQVSRATAQSNQVAEQSVKTSTETTQASAKEAQTIREVTAAREQALKVLAEFSVKQKETNKLTDQETMDALGRAAESTYAPPPATANAPRNQETTRELTEQQKLIQKINQENQKAPDALRRSFREWEAITREIERQEKLQQQINAQRAARPKVFAEAEKRGFVPGKPGFGVQATEEASTGISRTTFSYNELDGTLKRLTVTQDKFGNVLVDTQRRFRTLGDAIIKDTVEVFKWTVAVALIYAPLQKLQELTSLMIKNEAELANITVILGKAQSDLGSIFNAAAQAAKATGESIDGVLEGYTLAYRATGIYADAVQRAVVAQKLLVDSLTLAKLAGQGFAAGANDQAEALDTLVAALRQMGMGLDQGSVLLNKWVAVTKAANVDLKTLSESFAITATSAESAGLSIDELNGIIATISEATSLSATEAGNAVRAIISGLNTDQAKQKLQEYGIAVEDTSGKLRSFMDVFRDIAAMRTAGVIDDRGFKELATAIGGQGARRGAQVEAVLGNLSRAGELAKVSANAQNDAYDALGIKLDTVQTKITELNNAFQTLAQTLGEDGGMLETLKTILEVATGITNAFSGIIQTLGKAAPILAASGIGLAYANRTGKLGAAGGGLGNFLLQNSSITQALVRRGTPRLEGGMGAGIEDSVSEGFVNKTRLAAPAIGVAIAEAFVAGSNIRERNFEGLFGQVLGGAFGAIVGGPYGALIGSTIGQSIADTLFRYKTEFADFFTPVVPTAAGTGPGGQETETERLQRLAQEKVLQSAGGRPNVKVTQTLLNTIGAVSGQGSVTELQAAFGILESRARGRVGGKDLTGEILNKEKIEAAKKDLKEFYDLLEKGRESGSPFGDKEQGISTPFSEEVDAISKKNEQSMSALLKKYGDDLRTSLNEQKVSIKEFKDQTEFFAAGGSSVIRVYAALKGSATSLADDLTKISDILRDANTEQRSYVTELTTEIADLTNKISKLKDISVEGDIGVAGADRGQQAALEARKKVLQETTDEFLKGIDAANKFNSIKLTPVVSGEGLNMDEFNLVLKEAQRKQAEYLQSLALQQGLSPAMIEDLKKSYDPWFLYLEGKYKEITLLDPQQFEDAKKALEDLGKINIKPPEPFGIQSIDQEKEAFKAAYARASQFVSTRFPQYKMDEKEQGVIFKNNVTDILHLDNLITQLALQELIDVNKKQLEGIYNLPSDSSFYVPFQGYKLGPNGEGTAGGSLMGLDTAATNATGSLNTLANAINRMTGTYLPQNAMGPLPTSNLPQVNVAPPMTGTYLPEQQGQTVTAAIQAGFAKMTGTYLPATTPPKPTTQQTPEWMTNQYQVESKKRNAAYPGITYKPEEPLSLWNRPGLNIPAQPYKETVPQNPPVNTRLQLDINSNVLLQVDGRTLASIVKVYLYEDMIRTEGTAGSIVKAVII